MLRYGTVGSGWITDAYIHGARKSQLWELTCVYSRSAGRAAEYAKRNGAKHSFSDLEVMAKSDLLDAVYIASPNALHYSHCMTFLENGKHVICEKPICAQADKTAKLIETARRNGVVFMEAIMFMHMPQRHILDEAIKSIGKISFAKLDFCQRSSKLDEYNAGGIPNIFNPDLETGAFMDLGVYCVYPMLYYFGMPERITCRSAKLSSGADASGVVIAETGDTIINLTYSKIGQASAGSEFQGEKGTVYVDSISRLAGITITDTDGFKRRLYDSEEKFILMGYEAQHFHAYITQRDKHSALYEKCTEMALSVSRFMEFARRELQIRFASD